LTLLESIRLIRNPGVTRFRGGGALAIWATLTWEMDLDGARADLIDRYITLLQASLTGTVYGDDPMDNFSGGKYNPDTRALAEASEEVVREPRPRLVAHRLRLRLAFELDQLYDRVVPVGVVIVDDYGYAFGCKRR